MVAEKKKIHEINKIHSTTLLSLPIVCTFNSISRVCLVPTSTHLCSVKTHNEIPMAPPCRRSLSRLNCESLLYSHAIGYMRYAISAAHYFLVSLDSSSTYSPSSWKFKLDWHPLCRQRLFTVKNMKNCSKEFPISE